VQPVPPLDTQLTPRHQTPSRSQLECVPAIKLGFQRPPPLGVLMHRPLRHGCVSYPPAWVMLVSGGAVAKTNKTSTMLVDELAALNLAQRQELAAALRGLSGTLAGVSDGKTASHVLGVLAHLLDPS
jgi:hypothetical protein